MIRLGERRTTMVDAGDDGNEDDFRPAPVRSIFWV
jgi:hypothetical protein